MLSKNMSNDKAIKLLAKTMYRDLLLNGFTKKDVINFCKEVIDNITPEKVEYIETKEAIV